MQADTSITPQAIGMGLLAAFVGYAASSAIVLSGLYAIGASDSQAATGLFFASLAMGVCSVLLPWISKTPAAVAWSTPGAALLAVSPALGHGFSEAVAAFLLCACLLVLTGTLPSLGRVVASIPKPIANALLAGILLKLCMAPALAFQLNPLLVLPIVVAWLAGMLWNKILAMPFAVVSFLLVLFWQYHTGSGMDLNVQWIPPLEPVTPRFSFHAFVSIAIPLYLVTMAGQNIPGFAVLELHGYEVRRPFLLKATGVASMLAAPFGSIPVNMSAITAAMMCGEDAGKAAEQRYWAAIVCGVTYILFAFAAGLVTRLASVAPEGLIAAVAGLALIPALVASIAAAFENQNQREAPALTFLFAASGMTVLTVSGAFWGIVIGLIVWHLVEFKSATTETKGEQHK